MRCMLIGGIWAASRCVRGELSASKELSADAIDLNSVAGELRYDASYKMHALCLLVIFTSSADCLIVQLGDLASPKESDTVQLSKPNSVASISVCCM